VQNPPNRKGVFDGVIFPFSSIGLLHEPGNFLNVTLLLKKLKINFMLFNDCFGC
jgi:hypothetical protein